MVNRTTIKTSIINKLKTLSSVDATKVVGIEGIEASGYPFVTCVCIGSEAEQTDEINIMRTYKYRIRVLADMNSEQSGGVQWGEDTIMLAIDEIINAFDDDYTLSQTVENIIAVSDDLMYDITDSGITRVGEIILQVKYLYNITE